MLRAVLLLLPIAAFAQTPPPDVDQVLRARVNQFYQDYLDGAFRKAMDLVAEDSTEAFLATPKTQFKSFKIDSIQYTETFTKAAVQLNVQRMMKLSAQLPETLVAGPLTSRWRIESGKWMWYEDPAADAAAAAAGRSKIPDLSPEGIGATARGLLNQGSFDKSELQLTAGSTSGQVVFHNGFPGVVNVRLEEIPDVPGLRAELDKATLKTGENAVIRITYERPKNGPGPPSKVTVHLVLDPFGQAYPITVIFSQP